VQIGVAAVSIPSVIFLSAHGGFVGIWIALTIYMTVRAIASTWRYGRTPLHSFVQN
jgi:Na+-driven multidrug efflux pump